MITWVLHRAIDKFERDWNCHAGHRRHDASPRPPWVFSRVTNMLAAAALVGALGLAAPAAASASVQQAAASVPTLTPGRIVASTAAVVGLFGAVIGGLALARSAGRIGTGTGRRGAIVALVLAPIGLVVGGLVVATADGGFGTGHGLAGGIVAMIVGLIGTALGGLALSRSRRTLTARR